MAPDLDFNFYVGGIEDTMLAALKAGMPDTKATFATYSGQLDNSEELNKALGELSVSFPLVMASYAEGVDYQEPAISPVLGRPRPFRHECEFGVIVASDDARGESERRRGAYGTYPLIAGVKRVLTDLRLSKEVDGTNYPLTTAPLEPTTNEVVLKMANITAYIVFFRTAFKWTSLDRTSAGTAVTEFVLGVDSLNTPGQNDGSKPGVEFQ
jgi:Domain of unknown function (DUF1834)